MSGETMLRRVLVLTTAVGVMAAGAWRVGAEDTATQAPTTVQAAPVDTSAPETPAAKPEAREHHCSGHCAHSSGAHACTKGQADKTAASGMKDCAKDCAKDGGKACDKHCAKDECPRMKSEAASTASK